MNNFGGRGFGMGFGRGAGFGGRGGRGGGFGFRNRFYATGVPGWARFGGGMAAPFANTDPETEKQALNNQAEILQTELDAIKKRLEALNTNAQKK
jgi:ribosomal protein L15